MSRIRPEKRDLLEQLATLGKALGHPYRLELLEYVAQGERTVEALTELTRLPVATVSQHLQHLRRAGLVRPRREGKYVHYRITDDNVVGLLAALRGVAEHNIVEMQQLLESYFEGSQTLEAIHADDLTARLRDGLVTLLDVRPEQEYRTGHLPGAINIPAAELERRLRDLPPDREVVAYCRGPYCALAHKAVRVLREHGLQARRLADGYPEWRAAGLPVEEH
ncbi:ArsR/SmtB family transcription factor [Alkalilimnicola ehrlichii MLHE-1]|uniref:Transcriptional regulator, ArsR family n=1 Tax=Alkalilimnicola ehrlichii (strain ATCC BAA-1101 / DSM 17681 / MLHE-1) TaxID=187272 RepID=Q0AAM7_ALKEH|nr:metalloregulator ArsR/SmtB family transcription factor [Alkalilimnicola ehrlichii]ABI56110.1 transcriptional regulator, ArsR family [Alkalilimnicola ehrlichii MLHE-1]